MEKLKIRFLILLFVGVSEIVFPKVSTAEEIQLKAGDANHDLYPRFHFMIGYNPAGPHFIPVSQETNILSPVYKNLTSGSDEVIINAYWFFKRNFGITASFEREISKLTLTNSSHTDKTYKLYSTYTGYLGLQYRTLMGSEVILTQLLGLKSPFNYCCSLFAEVRTGFTYLTYEQEYLSFLQENQINNFPVNESKHAFPGLALKYRLGVTFYFPLIVLEIGMGEVWYLLNNHGQVAGFKGAEASISAGVYF